jgi:signal transduction histidine kinase
MKSSIVKKIFFSITGIFVFIMLIQMLFQNVFLEDVYWNTKVSKVERDFIGLSDDFISKDFSNEEINESIIDFTEDNQSAIVFFDETGTILNENFFDSFNSILIKDDSGIEHKIIVDFLVDERGSYRNFGRKLRLNDEVSVSGVLIKGTSYIMPIEIKSSKNTYINEEGEILLEFYKEVEKQFASVEGKILEENFVVRESGIFSYQHEKLFRELMNFINDDFSKDINTEEVLPNRFTEEDSGLEIITFIREVQVEGNKKVYCMALFTLANVHDAFVILNGYYTYIFLAQFLLIIVLAFLFTKKVTKPLLTLIDSAKSISELDFSKRTNIDTDDELSVLSDSLNSISTNLSHAMTELEKEAERKAKNEERMRNLLTSMSHEFKTPLGIISGFLDVVRHKAYEKDPDYYLDVISEEIEKMNELVLETIQLSKLETGSYEMNETSFNLDEFVNSSLKKFEMSIEGKNQKLIVDVKQVQVKGDIKKYEQVLNNFVSNGIRYSSEGETIEVLSKIDENLVYIYVRNYGVVLDDEDLDKIWDRYYRTEKSRNREFGGSGLGLTIVKTILELHGSDYGVRNIDNGVEFYFSLELL